MSSHSKPQEQHDLFGGWLPESLLVVLLLAFIVAMLVACAPVDAM